MSNIKCYLEPRLDKEEKVFYLAKLKGPVILDFKKGVAFLIFTSDEGEEELQIAPVDEYLNYNKYFKRFDRIKAELVARKDADKKVFYVSKIKMNATLDCSKGVSFLVFNSKIGEEELQIVGNFGFDKKTKTSKKVIPSFDDFSIEELKEQENDTLRTSLE